MEKKVFSKEEIRHYLVQHYSLDSLDACGKGKKGILNYISRVSCIQQDPLNIIGTNMDIIFFSRFSEYQPELLYQMLYEDRLLIEGWDKEACVYPSKEWGKYAFVRQESEKGSLATLRYRNQEEALKYVDDVIEKLETSSLPISSRELNLGKALGNRWGSADLGNIVLSYLWSRGDVIISKREERRKFYKISHDLPVESHFEKKEEFLEWYIYRRLMGMGIYWLKNGSGWLGHYMNERQRIIKKLIDSGKVIEVNVQGVNVPLYITVENYKKLLCLCESNYAPSPLRFIAPLDNFIWDRKFVKEIFDFEYVWEVYKPVEKRKYGYYVLPILYQDQFIGRIEPSRDKERKNTFEIKNIWFESEEYNIPEINEKIVSEVERYNNLFSRKRI